MVFVGFQVLGNPLAGMMSLTAALGFVLVIFEAVSKLFLAFTLDRNSGFWLMLLSAALSFRARLPDLLRFCVVVGHDAGRLPRR
jgi:uncharacterized membrane protein HdeD (DUF308 family)